MRDFLEASAYRTSSQHVSAGIIRRGPLSEVSVAAEPSVRECYTRHCPKAGLGSHNRAAARRSMASIHQDASRWGLVLQG